MLSGNLKRKAVSESDDKENRVDLLSLRPDSWRQKHGVGASGLFKPFKVYCSRVLVELTARMKCMKDHYGAVIESVC